MTKKNTEKECILEIPGESSKDSRVLYFAALPPHVNTPRRINACTCTQVYAQLHAPLHTALACQLENACKTWKLEPKKSRERRENFRELYRCGGLSLLESCVGDVW